MAKDRRKRPYVGHRVLCMGASSVLGVLVACGGTNGDEKPDASTMLPNEDASSPHDASHGPGEDAATDSAVPEADADVAADGGDDARLRFTVEIPGAAEAVEASLGSQADDAIRIDAYPGEVHTTVGHPTLPLAFEGAFDEAFCADIDELAMLASEGGPLSANARQRVRPDASLTAHVFLYPFVGPVFDMALRDAARAKGATAGAFTVENPLVLESASVELVLEDGATSHLIGDVEALGAAFTAALAARDVVARQTGVLTVALSAKDLWCDLARERASLVVRTRGKNGQAEFEAQTTARGVEALSSRGD